MRIKTEHFPSQISTQNLDWCAFDEDTYTLGGPQGWGRSEADAIEDLKKQIEVSA